MPAADRQLLLKRTAVARLEVVARSRWAKRRAVDDTASATAGNRTRINCLEGNYANHYTTVAVERPGRMGTASS